MSDIEWTEKTWNPVTGCDKVSAGCKHCYAEVMAKRQKGMGHAGYENGFALTLRPDRIDLPRKWLKPTTVFVNSMGDLFHKDVPADFIGQVFQTMAETPQHRYQVLTKRADRLEELAPWLPWPSNVWMGVSIENQDCVHRLACLKTVPAEVRFLSLEPLLGPLPNLDLDGIGWVIVGGESGPGARPMDPAWARDLRDQCLAASVPYFFKQWGGTQKKKAGRLLDGREHNDMPGVQLGKLLA